MHPREAWVGREERPVGEKDEAIEACDYPFPPWKVELIEHAPAECGAKDERCENLPHRLHLLAAGLLQQLATDFDELS